jgi:hypothetical protein
MPINPRPPVLSPNAALMAIGNAARFLEPADFLVAVTPDDDADLPDGATAFIFVTGDGDLEYRNVGESSGFHTIPVLAGQRIPVRAIRIGESTTASIAAGYYGNDDDITAPSVLLLTPLNDASNINVNTTITIQFDENIEFGDDIDIRIHNKNTLALVEGWSAETTGISITDDTLTINPTSDLPADSEFFILIGKRTIKDAAGNYWAGFAANDSYEISTLDLTAPTVATLTPVDGATDVAVDAEPTIEFNENVEFGATVLIEIRQTSDDALIEAFTEADIDAGIAIVDDLLTITPTDTFDLSAALYILVTAGSIQNIDNVPFAGILVKTGWNFTVVAA